MAPKRCTFAQAARPISMWSFRQYLIVTIPILYHNGFGTVRVNTQDLYRFQTESVKGVCFPARDEPHCTVYLLKAKSYQSNCLKSSVLGITLVGLLYIPKKLRIWDNTPAVYSDDESAMLMKKINGFKKRRLNHKSNNHHHQYEQ